jgi:tetraacyldisaccharide 4'-kinase
MGYESVGQRGSSLLLNAPEWWWTQEGTRVPYYRWPAWLAFRWVEACYKRIISVRNSRYNKLLESLPKTGENVPIISVGNITVGGSGKTPLTIWLAGMLRTKGRQPAIIARGYGAGPSGLNDELQLAMRKCPYAAVLANPDRTSAIRDAVTFHGATAAILDDAFQHRKVRRDLDIVLVDATRGFGNGHMLPAGPLREPINSLARADLVLLTRAEQVSPAHLETLLQRIGTEAGRDLPVGQIAFQPSGMTDLQFAAVDFPEGPGGAFAGIGNSSSFFRTCLQNGLDVIAQMPLSDHVRYDEALCRRISCWAVASGVTWLVTTEKDAVKLSRISRQWPVPVLVLAIRVVPNEATRILLEDRIDALLHCKAARA